MERVTTAVANSPLPSTADGTSHTLQQENVKILTEPQTDVPRDSCKVLSKVICSNAWSQRLYDGHLAALHKDGTLLAYVLEISERETGLSKSYVRLMTCCNQHYRDTLKGFNGFVTDIAWAHRSDPCNLAVVDEAGNIYVYNVTITPEQGKGITSSLKLKVFGMGGEVSQPCGAVYHVNWCPYVPDQMADAHNRQRDDSSASDQEISSLCSGGVESGDAVAQNMVAVWKQTTIHVLMIDSILANKSSEANLDDLTLDDGHCVLEQDSEITAAAISPDATALAVALADGTVKFFIFESLDQVKCAHCWKPHDGKVTETLVFLDNLKDNTLQDQFWKFALTASNGNRELKLFNCEEWQCLATLNIEAPSNHTRDGWGLLLRVDPTAKFVYVADMERKSLYSIELDWPEAQQVRFASFTDFPLHKPLLDMAVLSSARRKFRPFSPSEGEGYGADDDEAVKNSVFGVQAIIYAINPRDLVRMEIRYQSRETEQTDNGNSSLNSSVDTQSTRIYDTSFSDISMEIGNSSKAAEELERQADSVTPTAKAPHIRAPSPTSQEVTAILSPHNEDNNNLGVNDEMHNDERPVSPTVYTLEARDSVDEYERKSSSYVVDSRVDSMLSQVQKCNMELERVSAHLQKQADEVHDIAKFARTQDKYVNDIKSQLGDVSKQIGLITDGKILADNLAPLIKNALGDIVRPCVSECMQTMSQTIVQENDARLKATQSAIMEQIPKMVQSKAMTNAIATAVSDAISTQVQSTFSTALKQELLPAYDKALSNMFTQLNDVFNKGVNQYMQVIGEQGRGLQTSQQEHKAALLNHVTNVTDQMRTTLERSSAVAGDHMLKQVVQNVNAAVHTNMQTIEKGVKSSVVENMRAVVKEEVVKCLKDNQTQMAQMNDSVQKLLRSQTATPNSVVSVQQNNTKEDMQKEILQLLLQKDYNQAFQLALSACDLHVLMFACGKVDAREMFSRDTCPLTQPVVLSLLQQLATDLSTHAEMKLSFVEECLLAIDTRCADITDHWRNVLKKVKELLIKFQSRTSPSNSLGRQVKRCLIAITGVMDPQYVN